MPNRLASEPSLYLRQHADNPVDWYPWGDQAFERARSEDRPVLLSIGYSSCHWCHVMAHESFDNEGIARLMNEFFVNIKVDREERPDVDAIYMDAVQSMTGQGGWPLTIFLTPEGRPFWGGTYFPPEPRRGMPGFGEVLGAIAETWRSDRARVDEAAAKVVEHIDLHESRSRRPMPGGDLVERAAAGLLARYEPRFGGFEQAPKFPPPMALELLLRADVRDGDPPRLGAVTHTLDHMLWGGMYDQLGGGFHRYSVDGEWLIPHFEKMLYDNAQLARIYSIVWRITGKERYRRAATETVDFMLRELLVAGGGMAASQDADSGGEEGTYYSWTREQLVEALGEEDGEWVAGMYRVHPDGNFEHGTSVLSLEEEPTEQEWDRLQPLRLRLRELRSQRIAPETDHKVVAAWNGLALAALAEVGSALDRSDYLDAARDMARHLLETQTTDGVLHRTWHGGSGLGPAGFCEDYASVAHGLLALYEVTFEQGWFDAAVQFGDRLLEQFDDPQAGGFFATAAGAGSDLVLRPKDLSDHPIPSGNSMAATVLARLAQWFPERQYRDRAEAAVALVATGIAQMPSGLAQAAIALDQLTAPDPRELVVVTPGADASAADPFLGPLREGWHPHVAVAVGPAGTPHPGFQHRPASDGQATAYLCTGMTCQQPTTEPSALQAALA